MVVKMKKYLMSAIILFPVFVYAQGSIHTIKFGLFDPSATNSGFIIGYEGAKYIDENFSMGWSVDWFYKGYVDQDLVNQFNDFYGPNSSLNELRAKTNLHAIPLMGNIKANWPIAPRTRAYVEGSVGLEVLLIFYRNYENPDNNEFHGAFDFAWRIGAGAAYEIGRRSDLLFELGYHYSQPSWQYDVKDQATGRTKVFERKFDMSGIMLRMGVRFYF